MAFCRGEEPPAAALSGADVGEVNEEEVPHQPEEAGEDSFHDEDPSPARDAGQDAGGGGGVEFCGTVVKAEICGARAEAFHLHEAEGKDATASGGAAADDVEDAVAFLQIVSGVWVL